MSCMENGVLRTWSACNLSACAFVPSFEKVAHSTPHPFPLFRHHSEPLDNYTNVIEAIHSLSDPSVLNANPIPLRRITLSTVGVVHGIRKLAKESCPQIQLALSLHAPNDTIRERIVPTAKAFSIPKIMGAVDEYQQAAGRRYVLAVRRRSDVHSS